MSSLTDWLKQYKWHAAGGVALVLIISAAFMLLSGKRETSSDISIPEEASAQTFDKKEEVKLKKRGGRGGYHRFERRCEKSGRLSNEGGRQGARCIEKSRRHREKADQKQINLAAVLRDGMVLYIPFEGEEAAGSLSEADSRADAAQVISSISIRLPLRSFRRFPGSVLQKRKR